MKKNNVLDEFIKCSDYVIENKHEKYLERLDNIVSIDRYFEYIRPIYSFVDENNFLSMTSLIKLEAFIIENVVKINSFIADIKKEYNLNFDDNLNSLDGINFYNTFY